MRVNLVNAVPDTPGELWITEARQLLSSITLSVIEDGRSPWMAWDVVETESVWSHFHPGTPQRHREHTVATLRRLGDRMEPPFIEANPIRQ